MVLVCRLPLSQLCCRGARTRRIHRAVTTMATASTSMVSEYTSRQLDGTGRGEAGLTGASEKADQCPSPAPRAVIDFSVGQPGPHLLPLAKIHAAAAHRLDPQSEAALLLQYGPRQGYPSFRHDLAAFLTRRYGGHRVEADSLMACAGVSHGLDLVCRCLSKPGDTILVEQPTYYLARGIFVSNHLRVVGLPTDVDGLNTAALQDMLETWPTDQERPRLLYTIPVHNNPSATTLTLARRQHLVRLAHEYGFTIVADEVYQMLTLTEGAESPPPLRYFDLQRQQRGTGGAAGGSGGAAAPPSGGTAASSSSGAAAASSASRVVSLGSFSKILAPGLRLGWVEAGPEVMEALRNDGAIDSGGCIVSLACGIAHSAIQLGLLEEHLDKEVKPTLAAQCAALTAALREELPSCSFLEPTGGYFVWLKLPDKVCDAKQLLSHAEQAKLGVRFTPGATCGGRSAHIRLCFAFYPPHELREGVVRLKQALDTMG